MTLPQILAAGSIAVASTCIHGILVSGLASNSIPGVAINGWFILLSLVVSVFDIVAIGELFIDIRVLNIKIPFHHSLWYLSTIIVSFIRSRWLSNLIHHCHFYVFNLKKLVVSGLSILGYLGVIIPMTVFTGRWLGKLVEHKNNPSISEKNKAAYVQLTICAVLVLVSIKLKFYYIHYRLK